MKAVFLKYKDNYINYLQPDTRTMLERVKGASCSPLRLGSQTHIMMGGVIWKAVTRCCWSSLEGHPYDGNTARAIPAAAT